MKRDEVLKVLAEHREELEEFGVERLAVFGSVARDEAGPESDVDLLVEFDDRPIGLFEFVDLQHYLEDILGRPVDLVTRDGLKRQLRDRILEEAIPASSRLANTYRRYPRVYCEDRALHRRHDRGRVWRQRAGPRRSGA